jgi:hypothetical protein
MPSSNRATTPPRSGGQPEAQQRGALYASPPQAADVADAAMPLAAAPPQVADGEPLLKTDLNSSLPVGPQWMLSLTILGGIIVWLAIGNVAEGTIGEDCPMDSWLVPLGGGLLAYVAAFGFFSVPAKQVLKEVAPLVVIGLFAALFAWCGALLPYVIGCSSCSFMVILCVFNSGVSVEGPGGKAVVDYAFSHYRGYVSWMLVLGNGVMNALGHIFEHELEWSAWTRWLLATFLLPLLMLIPALLKIAKGQPNGQYNVPDESTFIRLFISTRLGIYFCMYYFVHYHFEKLITKEVLEVRVQQQQQPCVSVRFRCSFLRKRTKTLCSPLGFSCLSTEDLKQLLRLDVWSAPQLYGGLIAGMAAQPDCRWVLAGSAELPAARSRFSKQHMRCAALHRVLHP